MKRDFAIVVTLAGLLGWGASGAHAGALTGTAPEAWSQDALAAAFATAKSRLQGAKRMSERASISSFAERRAAADALRDAGAALDLAWPSATVAACPWSDRFRAGGPDDTVWAQLQFDDGSGPALYYGGEFLTAGGVEVNGVARWDGSAWTPLGVGMDGPVFALAAYDDGTGEALYAGGAFTEAGGVPADGIAKWDGTEWTALGSGVDGAVFALKELDGELFVGGYFTAAGGSSASSIASWDGATWSPLGLGVDGEVDALGIDIDDEGGEASLVVGGFFSAAGGVAADNFALWDGMSWSSPAGTDDGIVALATYKDQLYAAGFFSDAGGVFAPGIARWNNSWSALDMGLDAPGLALASFDDGAGGEDLYVGGLFRLAGSVPQFTPGIARWDGVSWTGLGSGIDDVLAFVDVDELISYAEVDSLAVFDDGGGDDLHVGGHFFVAGGTATPYAARWSGAAWSAVGLSGPDVSGLDGPILASVVYDDGNGPALYVGGRFSTAGGTVASAIARWDGSAWSPVGEGMSCDVPGGCFAPSVEALVVYDDGNGPALYAGGVFDFAGVATASNIARWDGTTWTALGSGVNGPVEALAVFSDGIDGYDLYAGGEFGEAGGTTRSNIARWNGSSWSGVGAGLDPGVDGDVETLVVFNDGGGDDLYAGGEFLNAGGVFVSHVARWNRSSWSALGTGTNDEVETLYVWDDGGGPALYAGGAFDVAGGVAASSVARWDGGSWSGLGTGIESIACCGRTVDAFAAFDDAAGAGTVLYAGGLFSSAGDVPALNVARWDGTAWSSPPAGGVDWEVETLTALAPEAATLFAGGFFERAGANPSSFAAALECAAAADLSVALTDGMESAAPGTLVTYTLTVANAGPDAAIGVTVTDAFPPGLAGATWTCAGSGGGACAPSGSGDLAQSVNLPVGGSVVFTLAAAVDPAATAVLVNTASAALPAGLSELSPADNSATDITSLDGCQLGALTVAGVTYSAGHMLASETSITTEGEVVVATGADVSFRAPLLAFGSGFRVESGAHFEALAQAVVCGEGAE